MEKFDRERNARYSWMRSLPCWMGEVRSCLLWPRRTPGKNIAPLEEKKAKDDTLSPSFSLCIFPSSQIFLCPMETPRQWSLVNIPFPSLVWDSSENALRFAELPGTSGRTDTCSFTVHPDTIQKGINQSV